jgi:two-component system response regulator RegX3
VVVATCRAAFRPPLRLFRGVPDRSPPSAGGGISSPEAEERWRADHRGLRAMTDLLEERFQSRSGGSPLILVVDDEASYREALNLGLVAEGFEVMLAADASEALATFAERTPDLVLLDVMLPDRSGLEVCREIKAGSNVPVVMVSAKSEELDVVVGLELGAADYVAKPYRLRELTARIRAVLRRVGGEAQDESSDEVLVVGPIALDPDRREVHVDGVGVELSRKEFDLLALLMAHSPMVVTREACLDALWWGQDLLDSRTLDAHVKRLRRKIEADPSEPRNLITVRGVGFRLQP